MVLPVVPVARVIGLLERPGLPEQAETLIRGVGVARPAAVVGVVRGGIWARAVSAGAGAARSAESGAGDADRGDRARGGR